MEKNPCYNPPMPNGNNRRQIDKARAALVGIIPDPKGQVEQITTALVYKYLDKLDSEAASIQGGRRTYFVDDTAEFSWEKLLSPSLTGDQRLLLYRRAVESMAESDKLGSVFGKMMRGASSPFQNPIVLQTFLHAIDELDCEHTENLGDAYEHLLSIMGTQKKVGQFRTPRHIIDFIVSAVAPQKNERVLDPACGSAGFLVAAHTHVMRHGDSLSPADKRKLAQNIVGHDIDPGMVRLAMVNLYLHKIKSPQVREYDSLSDDSLWEERADVILANPPFMTPRGGIQPHGRFMIPARRSEVLFVDYIAEHLSPQGRAGVIVPEGIIFQSGKAYKTLRKMLVEDWGLWAVASLPGGVFQPYATVKTSVLFLDKTRRHFKNVLFVKVPHDGFDLGANRNPIDENDLPAALKIISGYNDEKKVKHPLALAVAKTKIAEDGDYSFSADNYRKAATVNAKFPMVALRDICKIVPGEKSPVGSPDYLEIGDVDMKKKSYDISKKEKRTVAGAVRVPAGTVLISTVRPTRGAITTATSEVNVSSAFCRLKCDRYVFCMLCARRFFDFLGTRERGLNYPSCKEKDILDYQIPLPPLAEQERVVAEIDGYAKVRDGADAVAENWRPVVNVNPAWSLVKLGDISEFNPKKQEAKKIPKNRVVSFLPMADINANQICFSAKKEKPLGEVYAAYTYFAEGDVLLARVTPCFENGKSGIAKNLKNNIGFGSSEFFVYRPDKKKVLPEWIYFFIASDKFIRGGIPRMTGTGGLQRLTKDYAQNYQIPLPPLAEQERIIAEIEAERRAVSECRALSATMEQKITNTIARIWEDKP